MTKTAVSHRAGGEVVFAHAQFSGGAVVFGDAVFSGGTVVFNDAQFSGGEVSFGARFSGGEVFFLGAEFLGGVDFSNPGDWSRPPGIAKISPPPGVTLPAGAGPSPGLNW